MSLSFFFVTQGFGDGSILPEDLRQEEEEEEEPELILDGGLPRYTTSSLTSDLLPVEEGREMAVDEEVEEVKTEGGEEERMASLPRQPPPSWEEWKLASSGRARPEVSVSSCFCFFLFFLFVCLFFFNLVELQSVGHNFKKFLRSIKS